MLFLILDPSLYDSGGHNLDYVLAIVKELELQGIKPKIYANYKYNITTSNDANIDVIPFFTQGMRESEKLYVRIYSSIYERVRKLINGFSNKNLIEKYEPYLNRAHNLVAQLLEIVKREKEEKISGILIPTITWADALLISEIYNKNKDMPNINLILRFDPPKEKKIIDRIKRSFAQSCGKLHIWCDTIELAKAYSNLINASVNCVSIPCNPRITAPCEEKTIVFLGESRRDKGFHLLPEIISHAMPKLKGRNYKFIIQILGNSGFDEVISSAANKLRDIKSKHLEIIEGPINTKEYNKLLQKASVSLCLHDHQQYSLRSAGIITQSIYIGIPIVILKGNSSPLNMIYRNNCEDIVFEAEENSQSIINSIIKALSVNEYRQRHIDCVDDWSAPWINIK